MKIPKKTIFILSLVLCCCGCQSHSASAPSDPSIKETTTEDISWLTGKSSGTLEDYNAYFKIDMALYESESASQGTIEAFTYHSQVAGADRKAYIYKPYGFDETLTYPVLYLLHGIGCDCEQWVSMNLNNILSNLIEKGEVQPFIAIIPSVIPGDGLNKVTLSSENIQAFTDFPEEFQKDLEPYVLSTYPVSSDRGNTAVCGLSMGGMEALSIGFTLRDRFNYIGSFSAAPSLDTHLLAAEEEMPELLLLCSGDADHTVGNTPMSYHNLLTEEGIDHIWYQYPGGGHSPEVWKSGLVNFIKRIF